MLRGLLCHVNLIPLNPVTGTEFTRSRNERIRRFEEVLARAGIPVTIRDSRGSDIQAGCGQLRRRDGQSPRSPR